MARRRPCELSRNGQTCIPSFPDYPHIHLLSPRPLLQLLLLLLLSRSAHGHAARLKIPVPPRTARVPTIILPSRGFSCCCISQLPRGYHPPCVHYAFTIGKFRRWWYSSPPCSTFGGWRLIPAGFPFCPALDTGLHLNQLTESKALLQYPRTSSCTGACSSRFLECS